jgi:CRISP-associated protein Cas1
MPIVAQLIADEFGTHVGKYQRRLRVTRKGKTLTQAPLMHLESVHILSRGVSVSSDAIAACCERGIPIYFIDSQGGPFATLYAAGLTGTVITRREQIRAYDDERGFQISVLLANAKIENQANTLRYLARSRKETPEGQELKLCADEVLDCTRTLDDMPPNHVDQTRASIMACEGQAARIYWEAVRPILPEDYNWKKRDGCGATDPINSLLNYGYGILYGQIERALMLAGLDPYAGYIHADRPGKPSLVLDMIEPFRQIAVDRPVFGLANRGFAVDLDERGYMVDATRKTFAEHILNRIEAKVRYQGDRQILRCVIQSQARMLAAFLRGERNSYQPFRAEV